MKKVLQLLALMLRAIVMMPGMFSSMFFGGKKQKTVFVPVQHVPEFFDDSAEETPAESGTENEYFRAHHAAELKAEREKNQLVLDYAKAVLSGAKSPSNGNILGERLGDRRLGKWLSELDSNELRTLASVSKDQLKRHLAGKQQIYDLPRLGETKSQAEKDEEKRLEQKKRPPPPPPEDENPDDKHGKKPGPK